VTAKADFNAEEWSTVLAAPPAAGMRVAIASRGGTFRESIAMGHAYEDARKEQGASEILDEIVSEQPSLDPKAVEDPSNPAPSLMRQLDEGVATLARHAEPADVDAYKQFILDLARRVASAKKEGGVLGIGGKEISEDEQAALDEIAAALGLEASGDA
jgi:hypothetical protein